MGREGHDRWAACVDHATSRRSVIAAAVAGVLAAFVGDRAAAPARAQEDATPCPATTPEASKEIARAYFAAFDAGDADALDALLAPNYAHHGALVAEQDRELHKQRVLTNHTAFPDGHYELEDVIAQDDLVAVRWVLTGHLQAEYAGVAPTGQAVAVRGGHIHRIACGKIVETWNSGDALGLLRQIGALPGGGPVARSALPAASLAAATPAAGCPAPTADESARIARRWTEDALDRHDLDILDEIVAPDVVHHAGVFVDEHGLPALKTDLAALLTGFPDVRFTADVVAAEGGRAAVRWTGRGTHNGEFLGLAPTGRPIVFTGINFYRIACGKIVEGWSEPDSLGLLQQLGVVPALPGLATPTAATPTA